MIPQGKGKVLGYHSPKLALTQRDTDGVPGIAVLPHSRDQLLFIVLEADGQGAASQRNRRGLLPSF